MSFAPWTGAGSHCSGSATPGARALMAWCLEQFPVATNGGIYVCRPVRGGTSLSLHAVGRAGDVMFPLVAGNPNPNGLRLVQLLRPKAAQLGVQCLIWNRRIWSAKSPGVAGRPYNGVNPHHDHVHFELSPTAGLHLTKATVKAVMGAIVTPQGRPVLTLGSEGAAVAFVQRKLGLVADGQFGPRTAAAVREFKRGHGLSADSVVGPSAWRLLDG